MIRNVLKQRVLTVDVIKRAIGIKSPAAHGEVECDDDD
jgi:hypothetical protein